MLCGENPLQYEQILNLPLAIVVFNAEQRIKSMTEEAKAIAKSTGKKTAF